MSETAARPRPPRTSEGSTKPSSEPPKPSESSPKPSEKTAAAEEQTPREFPNDRNPLVWRPANEDGQQRFPQVARLRDGTGRVAIRGRTEFRSYSTLLFDADEWDRFKQGVLTGEFD